MSADTTTRRAPARAHVLAVLLALGVASGVGLLGAVLRDDDALLFGAVLAACTLGPSYALAWVLLISGHVVDEDPHPEENVERAWWDRAARDALLDLLGACGIALLALSVTGLEVSGVAVLVGVVLLGMADVTVRYVALSRREA
jgi:hypothetical protein